MTLDSWSNFFLGELGASAALAGLLFVSVSVNQTRILALGRMADRGLEALAMLFLVIVVASLPLVPGQPLRLLGAEILAVGIVTFLAIVPLQRAYLGSTQPIYLRQTSRMVGINRIAVGLIALAGGVVACCRDGIGLYFLPPGILLIFIASGANAWVLLIEINR